MREKAGKDRGIATRIETGDDIAIGALRDLVGYHLRRASTVFANDFSRTLAGTGIRQVLFGVLSIIQANPGINQGNVGRALGIQRANMVSLVNELVERDLVLREVAADDRRAFSLSLTKAGNAIVDECIRRIRQHEVELLSDMSAEEQATLIGLLRRIEAKEA